MQNLFYRVQGRSALRQVEAPFELDYYRENPEQTLELAAEDFYDAEPAPDFFPIEVYVYADKSKKECICFGTVNLDFAPQFEAFVDEESPNV